MKISNCGIANSQIENIQNSGTGLADDGVDFGGAGGCGRWRQRGGAVVAVRIRALTVREESGQIGVAAWTLFDAGLDAGAGGWEFEFAMLAISEWAAAVWSERRKGGAAFEAMFFGIFDF